MLFNPEHLPKVALSQMNAVHLEEIELINRIYQELNTSPSSEEIHIINLLETFLSHLEEHFESENQLMKEKSFPAYECHVEEHRKVLATINHHINEYFVDRNRNSLKLFIKHEFKPWIENHISTMDMVTANYINTLGI
jgi:hemerythrin